MHVTDDDVLPGPLSQPEFEESDAASQSSASSTYSHTYSSRDPLTSSRSNLSPKNYGSTLLTSRPPAVNSPSVARDDKLSRSVTMLEPLNRNFEEESRREEEEEDELELDVLMRRVERLEVEAQVGVALWEIPVAVVVVWRLDAFVISNLSLSLSHLKSTNRGVGG